MTHCLGDRSEAAWVSSQNHTNFILLKATGMQISVMHRCAFCLFLFCLRQCRADPRMQPTHICFINIAEGLSKERRKRLSVEASRVCLCIHELYEHFPISAIFGAPIRPIPTTLSHPSILTVTVSNTSFYGEKAFLRRKERALAPVAARVSVDETRK